MMFYQKIADGISMPMLGFGTFMNTGADCERTVAEAIHTGYRLIDTAEAYGNEEQVGRGIKAGVENSLRLLGTDYFDLVLLHWPFADYYTAWRELEKLHKAGYICAIGVSNFEPDRLIDLIAYNDVKPVINQIETHLIVSDRRNISGKISTTLHIWRMHRWDRGRQMKCSQNRLRKRLLQNMEKLLHKFCFPAPCRIIQLLSRNLFIRNALPRISMCLTLN